MLKKTLIKIIKFYQLFVSPFLGENCRFWPSCSEYSLKKIEKDGILKGGASTLKRIVKCGPWHKGGIDLP